MSWLQIICILIMQISTIVGVTTFSAAIFTLYKKIAIGKGAQAPEISYFRPVIPRIKNTVFSIISHKAFKNKPIVRIAHWLVMVSFPILVFTLISGYAQLFEADWVLPVLGHNLVWQLITEFIAYFALVSIIYLIVLRLRLTYGKNADKSRFKGSNAGQAYYIEFTVLAVIVCVVILRACDYILLNSQGVYQGLQWQYIISSQVARLFENLSTDQLISIIWVCSTVKIVISMLWFAVVGVNTSMGIAWHRFLAIVNIYAKTPVIDYSATTPATQNTATKSQSQQLSEAETKQPSATSTAPRLLTEPVVSVDKKALGALPNLYLNNQILTEEKLVDYYENMDEDSPEPVVGLSKITDFTWKGLLDLNTCTECGRCQEVCPAYNAGKSLSPKSLIMSLRDHHNEVADDVLVPRQNDTEIELPDLVPNVISQEDLWACTTCGACTDQCPVEIEHLDHIVNLRRNQVVVQSQFPKQLASVYKKLETKSNPWGLPAKRRTDWLKNIDFEIPVLGQDIESAEDIEYLFWIGCAGAFDDKAKKTTVAVARLLNMAKVKFAILGQQENCTGDPARRSGNELLFQALAHSNIETLQSYRVKKIIASCAHCFNTFANEYPSLGGRYEVLHHTQVLNKLVRDGALKLSSNYGSGKTLTYHDPCYLGRHNGVYDQPRQDLDSLGFTTVEMAHSKERALCCGAGGANAFVEDESDSRISTLRAKEVVASGACVLATACPYCTLMLDEASRMGDVQIKDVAVLMLESALQAQEESAELITDIN